MDAEVRSVADGEMSLVPVSGDIKFILLGLLSERPQHGYELMKELKPVAVAFAALVHLFIQRFRCWKKAVI